MAIINFLVVLATLSNLASAKNVRGISTKEDSTSIKNQVQKAFTANNIKSFSKDLDTTINDFGLPNTGYFVLALFKDSTCTELAWAISKSLNVCYVTFTGSSMVK